jgi:hypothetical protein
MRKLQQYANSIIISQSRNYGKHTKIAPFLAPRLNHYLSLRLFNKLRIGGVIARYKRVFFLFYELRIASHRVLGANRTIIASVVTLIL